MFKKFIRILSYIKPYWLSGVLNIFFNLSVIVFSLVSFIMLPPFLNLLFGIAKPVTEKPVLQLSSKSLMENLNFYLGKVIQENGTTQALVIICFVLLGMFFFRNLFRFLAMYTIAKVRTGGVKGIRDSIYKKLLILPLSYYSGQKKGDIIARISTDVQEIEYSVMAYLEVIVRDPITIIIFFITLFVISPQLTLFVLVMLPVTGLIIGQIGKSLRRKSKIGQAKFAGLLAIIEETISGLRIIKGFTAIDFSNQRFVRLNENYTKTILGIYRRRDLSSPLSEFLSSVVIIMVLWFGGRLVLSSDATIDAAMFIAYIVIFSQIIPPAKNLATGYYSIQKGMASAERIFEILDAAEVIKEKPDAVSISDFSEVIEYRNLFFKYQNEYVLKNINCKIEKGKVIALVGPSGGGKSTFADMLPRFYDAVKGELLIDGVNIKDYKINDVRGLMGIVTQEAILFNDTVFNNIAFGKIDVTEEDVIRAAKIANAHEFIERMDQGYQTTIGDRGSNLSGGQRQRLSIARAILRNPPILILDEATSALDTESERLVQEALSNVMSNRTSLVIAHRLSTIIHADEIIVLEKGEISERGTHSELLKKAGTYHKLYQLQSFNS